MNDCAKTTLLRNAAFLLTILVVALVPPVSAQKAETMPEWKRYALDRISRPLLIDILWNKQSDTSEPGLILGLEGDRVVFRQDSTGGEASIKKDELGQLYFKATLPDYYIKAMNRAGTKRFKEEDLEQMRKHSYAMCRFLSIPEAHCNLHKATLQFAKGLIQLDHLEEAALLYEYIPTELVGLNFEQQGLILVTRLLDVRKDTIALQVLEGLPIEKLNPANLRAAMPILHRYRDYGYYAESKALYQRILKNERRVDDEAQYWIYYCDIALNQAQKDHKFADAVGSLTPESPFFALQQLILGRYYLDRNFVPEAMREISYGIAYAKPTQNWTPELMYRCAQAYSLIEEEATAVAVSNEIVLFFPTSYWAEEAGILTLEIAPTKPTSQEIN